MKVNLDDWTCNDWLAQLQSAAHAPVCVNELTLFCTFSGMWSTHSCPHPPWAYLIQTQKNNVIAKSLHETWIFTSMHLELSSKLCLYRIWFSNNRRVNIISKKLYRQILVHCHLAYTSILRPCIYPMEEGEANWAASTSKSWVNISCAYIEL